MTVKWSKTDTNLLSILAEYRCLSLVQLSLLSGRNLKALRRRVAQLRERDAVEVCQRGYGRSRGRPEHVVMPTRQTVQHLLEKNGIAAKGKREIFSKFPTTELDHQLLVNWFRIHLQALEKSPHPLQTDFLAPTSPFLAKLPNGHLPVYDRIEEGEGDDRWEEFIPDGVFTISYGKEDAGRSLLLFLEVDMGTEPLAAPDRGGRDLRQKILNYQSYFRSQRYKRYEEFWKCRFSGFRLLFIANTNARQSAISRLVQEIPPSNFIWVTDQQRMFRQGLGAPIWERGGKNQTAPQSILGPKLAFETPLIKGQLPCPFELSRFSVTIRYCYLS